jgi:hypothetical protein
VCVRGGLPVRHDIELVSATLVVQAIVQPPSRPNSNPNPTRRRRNRASSTVDVLLLGTAVDAWMMTFRAPFLRTSRLFPRLLRRQHTGPPPTHPPNEPIYVSPDLLRRSSSPLNSILRWTLGGVCFALPCYWIVGMGKTVSIPYCTPPPCAIDSFFWGGGLMGRCWTTGFVSDKVDGSTEDGFDEYFPGI